MNTQRKIGAMLAVAGGLTLAAVPGAAIARCYAAPSSSYKAKKAKTKKVSACAAACASACAASCAPACAAACGACAASDGACAASCGAACAAACAP